MIFRQPGKRYLVAECALLFFIIPAALYFVRTHLAFRIVPLMWIVSMAACIFLNKTGRLPSRQLWAAEKLTRNLIEILSVFIPCAAVLTVLAWAFIPDRFLAFPQSRPMVWLIFMGLYPVLMAYPQEVFFRTYFFRRYEAIFPDKQVMLAVNAMSFGIAHMIYGNWLAPLMSTAGGLLFAWRYRRSGSVLVTSIEHGLWGNFLFTSGYGWYFYSGAIA